MIFYIIAALASSGLEEPKSQATAQIVLSHCVPAHVVVPVFSSHIDAKAQGVIAARTILAGRAAQGEQVPQLCEDQPDIALSDHVKTHETASKNSHQ